MVRRTYKASLNTLTETLTTEASRKTKNLSHAIPDDDEYNHSGRNISVSKGTVAIPCAHS